MKTALRLSVVAWIGFVASAAAQTPEISPAAASRPTASFTPSLAAAYAEAADHGPAGASCPTGGCRHCLSCTQVFPPGGDCWFRAEYLLWWIRDANVPPLVTTGSPADAVPGAIGQPGTVVLTDDELDYGSLSGARFTLGTWLDDCRTHGVELGYFFLEEGSDDFSAASPGSPVLGRPFFDVGAGTPSVELGAFPGVVAGRIDVRSDSQFMGAELNGLCNLWCEKACGCEPRGHRGDFIYGFRYLDLDESLAVSEQATLLTSLPAGRVFPTMPAPAGTQLGVFDQFETQNRFYGGQVGMRWEARRGRTFVWLLGKVALGSTHQEVRISGESFANIPGSGVQRFPGGELAQPTNIGEYDRDRFSVVPEIGVTLGYQATDRLSLLAGYTFIYWSNVVRPGDQIDTGVNVSQRFGGTLVGPARPAFAFDETDFWAHGLSLGAAYNF